jgi:hypothetical protein
VTAASFGPALPAFSGTRQVSVHSVFRSALNLRVDGCDILATLTGAVGVIYPHAVSLDSSPDFRELGLEVGIEGEWGSASIRLDSARGQVIVDCSRAWRRRRDALVPVLRFGEACSACIAALAAIQDSTGTELRIGCLLSGETPVSAAATALVAGARQLAEAVAEAADLAQAVLLLVGTGPGLTPAGDDFLTGFLAAAPPVEGTALALGATIEALLGRTTDISASMLRCAIRGFFPTPIADLSRSLAADDRGSAIAALRCLCSIGHSSGADMATGLLFGLSMRSKFTLSRFPGAV